MLKIPRYPKCRISRQSVPFSILLSTIISSGCAAPVDEASLSEVQLEQNSSTDALAQAFDAFTTRFEGQGQHQNFRMGFAAAAAITSGPDSVRGLADLNFSNGRIEAEVTGLDSTASVSLWLYKNVQGSGTSAGPDAGDEFLFVGDLFDTSNGNKTLGVQLAVEIRFDFDAILLTAQGEDPQDAPLAIGFRTLFEKRYFREKFGISSTEPVGVFGANTPTTNPLIGLGANVFFNETFGGNGRSCGTCHRAENNMTIDAKFIATLPDDDPLFVAKEDTPLEGLENNALLRSEGLIKENIDGFDDLENKFVLRGVQHTFGLAESVSNTVDTLTSSGEMTGWSGDGAPGRGTLLEFALGAVVQHMPQTLARVPGIDFRVPSQIELDAMEAFQIFSGRQSTFGVTFVEFVDSDVELGHSLFEGEGACTTCHFNGGAIDRSVNTSFNTAVSGRAEAIALNLPEDGGAGREFNGNGIFGNGEFNTSPLIEAADTPPFFHNNSAATLEDAIAHYSSSLFKSSPAAAGSLAAANINLDPAQVSQVAAYLRMLNVAENLRQVRERVIYIRDHTGSGRDDLLVTAVADVGDAIEVLQEQSLMPSVQAELIAIRNTLQVAQLNPEATWSTFMSNVLVWLDIVKPHIIANEVVDNF